MRKFQLHNGIDPCAPGSNLPTSELQDFVNTNRTSPTRMLVFTWKTSCWNGGRSSKILRRLAEYKGHRTQLIRRCRKSSHNQHSLDVVCISQGNNNTSSSHC